MTAKQSEQTQASVIARHRYLEVLHQFTMSQASMTSVDDICWNIAKTAIGDLGFVDCVVYLISADVEQLIQRAPHIDMAPGATDVTPVAALSGATIVVCEDSDTVASLIKIVLEREGATVHTATNGQEGVALIESPSAAIDLVVTDIQMPVMNGHEVSCHLRKTGWRGPIVALTAFAAVEDERRCLEAGCTDYLTKPIDVKVFPKAITQHLTKKRDHSV